MLKEDKSVECSKCEHKEIRRIVTSNCYKEVGGKINQRNNQVKREVKENKKKQAIRGRGKERKRNKQKQNNKKALAFKRQDK